MSGGSRRASSAPSGGEVDLERIYRHSRTTPLDPETGQITGDRAHVAFAVAAMRVVVEVDVELGLTRVVWIGTAQDVGKAVNPLAVEGQIEGGTAQGLGLALMEEIQTRDGLITNASFTDYLIPTTLDMPPVESVLVEDPEPGAPYGVKGVGEPPTVVSTAAIVSALRDATGRELTRVPVRPDDIVGLNLEVCATMPGSQARTAAATASRSVFRPWSPGTCDHRAKHPRGRDPESVSRTLHHEQRNRNRVELGQTTQRCGRAGAGRRLQREGEAEHADRTGRRRSAARHPRARRAPAARRAATPRSSPSRSCSTTSIQAASSWCAGAGERRPATR